MKVEQVALQHAFVAADEAKTDQDNYATGGLETVRLFF